MKRSEAMRLRKVIEQAAQSLDDKTALTAIPLHPVWAVGTEYAVGHKVQYDGKLWRVLQTHNSQTGWEPENVPALWEQINETHSGTADDPIPYDGNMALVNGLYYTQDGVAYLCIRDTGVPVYIRLPDLVGLYVEKASEDFSGTQSF